MPVEIHYGDAILLDSIGEGEDVFEVDHDWSLDLEDSFRSPQRWGRGRGNAAAIVRFSLVSHHDTYAEQLAWRLGLYSALYGSDLTSPRDLWYLDDNGMPFSFGMSLAQKPRFIDDGSTDDGEFVTVTQYEFICGLLAPGGVSSSSSGSSAGILYMPNLWIPNQHGIVLRRTSDLAYIQIVWDMDVGDFSFSGLGGDPGTANLQTISTDVEWPAAGRGFGFYETGKFRLMSLDDLKQLSASPGTSDADFAAGATLAKGLLFAPGKGPILRTPSNYRMKMTVGSSNIVDWQTP